MNRRSLVGIGSIALGAGLAANALLGPVAADAIRYRITETLLNQTIGLEAVSLALVAPLAVAAGLATLRGHPAGPVLALGPALYTAYMAVQYVLGPDYLGLPGNNERFFPLHLGLFVLGLLVAVAAWNAVDTERTRVPRRVALLAGRVLLPVAGLLAFSRYVPALADAASGDPGDAGYLAGPTFFWTIALLDLGIALPALVAACVGLVRDAPWAGRAAYAVSGWLALVGLAVAGMAIVMEARGDPASSPGLAVGMTVLGVALVGLAVVLHRPLFRRPVRMRLAAGRRSIMIRGRVDEHEARHRGRGRRDRRHDRRL